MSRALLEECMKGRPTARIAQTPRVEAESAELAERMRADDCDDAELRAVAHASRAALPCLRAAGWRLDYTARTGQLSRFGEAFYVLTLSLSDGTDVRFACTYEELQDMSYKLQEATHMLD